ncbi:MAG: hypothetical protein KTR31_16805 [Myxococcales bacterium]|nr:hypothetical protein [Myxococcales bacterium]
MRACSLLLLALPGCTIVLENDFATSTLEIEPPEESTALQLRMEVGDIDIVSGDRHRIQADFEWTGQATGSPQLVRDERDGVADYALSCPDGSHNCRVHLSVTLPDEVATTTLDVAFLDLETFGLATDLVVRSDVTSIALSGHDGDVDVQMAQGDVTALDVCAEEISVQGQTADVELDVCDRPRLVQVGLDLGDIEIVVPTGGYVLETDAGAFGEVTLVNVTQDPQADAALRAILREVGDIEIMGR